MAPRSALQPMQLALLVALAVSACAQDASPDLTAKVAALEQEKTQLQTNIQTLQTTLKSWEEAYNSKAKAVATLEAHVTQLKDEKENALAAIKAWETAAADTKKRLSEIEEELNTCHTHFISKEHEAAQSLRTLRSELEAAQLELSQAKETCSATFTTRITRLASSVANSTTAVVMDLARGNATSLTKTAAEVASSLSLATGAARAIVERELRERLPGVQAKLNEASGLWRQHVTDSAWAAAAREQLTRVEAELQAVVVSSGSKVPFLAPIVADPVTVQLIVYAVLVLPLALLALPLLVVCCRAPAAAEAAAGPKGRKTRTKASFAKGGVNRLTSFERNVRGV